MDDRIEQLIGHYSRWHYSNYMNAANEWIIRKGAFEIKDIAKNHGCNLTILTKVAQVLILEKYNLADKYFNQLIHK
jgi:hypothetical protein